MNGIFTSCKLQVTSASNFLHESKKVRNKTRKLNNYLMY